VHHAQGLGALIIKNQNNRNTDSSFQYKTIDVGKKQDGASQMEKGSDLKVQAAKDAQNAQSIKNSP